ncbi:putative monooxygenase [Streptomyces bingchenggensis BCW-1]|uniref:Putative monooxygenase n=1 Tax=Streptomyces bingchenggensis (strain BCW-1) TaxID=749414 RepID=D7BW95_STRBB|nr:putative monooxygenase [Streptomyces bingchenggensis BCW-1]
MGAGLYLWDNGLFALDSIGALAGAVDGAHEAPAVEMRTRSGKTLMRININGEGRPRCVTILRNQLIKALVNAAKDAGVELVTDSAVLAVRPEGEVHFGQGRVHTADLVVVADGVHSRLRDSVDLSYTRIRMRQGAARIMIPQSGGYLPAEDSVKLLESFHGSRRLLYTPCTPEHVYLAFTCDADDPAINGSYVNTAEWSRSFPALAMVLRATEGVPVTRWDTFEYVRLATWSRGKVAFLGDAAHAQPPYLGQGGGTAMTNAVALAAAVSRPGLELPDALQTWERETRPGVERTQRTSYRMRLLNRVPDGVRNPLVRLAGLTSSSANSQLAATRLRPKLTSENPKNPKNPEHPDITKETQ